jgi:hypothetical protein
MKKEFNIIFLIIVLVSYPVKEVLSGEDVKIKKLSKFPSWSFSSSPTDAPMRYDEERYERKKRSRKKLKKLREQSKRNTVKTVAGGKFDLLKKSPEQIQKSEEKKQRWAREMVGDCQRLKKKGLLKTNVMANVCQKYLNK